MEESVWGIALLCFLTFSKTRGGNVWEMLIALLFSPSAGFLQDKWIEESVWEMLIALLFSPSAGFLQDKWIEESVWEMLIALWCFLLRSFQDKWRKVYGVQEICAIKGIPSVPF